MILKPDANIRLGDFNSPAFCLVGAVCPRNRVHNFTAGFPCDVGDAIRAACKQVNKFKLILAVLPCVENFVLNFQSKTVCVSFLQVFTS